MRHLSIFLLFILFFFPLALLGQINFQKVIGTPGSDEGYSLLQTTDNRIILTGLTETSGDNGKDILLMELDQEAKIIWSKALGGQQDDFARSIIQTTDRGFAIVGSTESFGQGEEDLFIIKTSRDGIIEWARSLGGNAEERGFSLSQTKEGGYVVGGSTTSIGSGKRDAILYKLDANGNLEWSRVYGGFDNDNIFHILQTDDGGYVFTGVQYSFGAGSHDFWVVRLDSQGLVLWAKSYGGGNEEHSRIILPSPDGNFLVIGHTLTFGAGGWDFLLLKITPNGDLIWAKTYGTAGDELSGSVAIMENGNILIYGFSSNSINGERDAIVVEVSPGGQINRASTFGATGNDFPQFGPDSPLILINNGSFLLTGTKTIGQFGKEDVFLVKTSLDDIHECESNNVILLETQVNNLAVSNIVPNETTPPPPQGMIPMESFLVFEESLVCASPIAKIHALDTIICAGNCITLIDSSLYDPTTFNWRLSSGQPSTSTQQNVNSVCFSEAGTYEVSLVVANGFGADTAFQTITVNPNPIIDLGNELVLCKDSSLLLSAFTPNATYRWQDNSTESDFTATTGGDYSVTVTLNNCIQDASITLEEITCNPPIAKIVTSDFEICAGECISVMDSSLNIPTVISWEFPGAEPSSSSQAIVSNVCYDLPGAYEIKLIVENDFGTDGDLKTIIVKPIPDVDLGDDITICEGDSILLSIFLPNATYRWQDGSNESMFNVNSAGVYSVEVELDGCTQESVITVSSENCTQCEFYIPNAFSPNADGVNDQFLVFSNCLFESYNMKIFDRWGELLFDTDNPISGWNGIFRNQLMNTDVFTYYISVSFLQMGQMKSEVLTGAVTLVR